MKFKEVLSVHRCRLEVGVEVAAVRWGVAIVRVS